MRARCQSSKTLTQSVWRNAKTSTVVGDMLYWIILPQWPTDGISARRKGSGRKTGTLSTSPGQQLRERDFIFIVELDLLVYAEVVQSISFRVSPCFFSLRGLEGPTSVLFVVSVRIKFFVTLMEGHPSIGWRSYNLASSEILLLSSPESIQLVFIGPIRVLMSESIIRASKNWLSRNSVRIRRRPIKPWIYHVS